MHEDKLKSFGVGPELERRLRAPDCQSVLVLGGCDSGKTSLVEALASVLAESGRVGLVDQDLGQSHLGPPTTIGCAVLEGSFPGWPNVKTEQLFFVGAITPVGNLLPTITGTQRMFEVARERADKVLIDTTGLVDHGPGKALHQNVIDLIRPDLVLALQREKELEHILAPFGNCEEPEICRLPVSSEVRLKTRHERAAYRDQQFREYFRTARRMSLDRERLCFRDAGALRPGRLVSLRDRRSIDLALGVVAEVGAEDGRLAITSPWTEPDAVRSVICSTFCIEEVGDGEGE